jgi:prepilin-type N-terminal cleavage/methylation domain-containing protein
MARKRRRGRDEAGMTMVELLVAVSLFSVVLTGILGVLVSVQNGLARQADRTTSNDQARLAVEELDREIRSGNVLYDPTLGYYCQITPQPTGCATTDVANSINPGMSLLVYTQANAPTREAGGLSGERCVQWRVKANAQSVNELQRREWTKDATSPGRWTVVADHLVNQAGTSPAFAVDPLKRIVNISILVNQNSKSGSTARVDLSVEGRNTVYNYPTALCLNASPSFISS